jgi:hypothetical protein
MVYSQGQVGQEYNHTDIWYVDSRGALHYEFWKNNTYYQRLCIHIMYENVNIICKIM